MKALGKHILLDFSGCNPQVLKESSKVRAILLDAVSRSGATIVTDVFHNFSPYGVSGVIVISESHVAIHTWPEHGVAAVDIFSCSERMRTEIIEETLKLAFESSTLVRKEITRG